MSNPQEPQGVAFFSVKSRETRYAKMEAQIQGYLNSSDMGINASRGQDYGWRLHPDWVKKVRAFRRDETKMSALQARNGGQKVTVPQVLYAIYGEQLRAYAEQVEEDGDPYEQEYLEAIREPKTPQVETPDPLPETSFDEGELDDDISDLVDDADLEPGEPETVEETEDDSVNRDAGTGQFVSDETAANDPDGTVTETTTPPRQSNKKSRGRRNKAR